MTVLSKPKYRHAHQQQRARWAPVVAAGEAYCVEPVCKMRTRWIAPGSSWDLAHDETGTMWTGPSHARCNRSEGASRGNRQRGRKPKTVRRAATTGRWVL